MQDAAKVPGWILGDIIETFTTGHITGFVWVLLAFGAFLLWNAFRGR